MGQRGVLRWLSEWQPFGEFPGPYAVKTRTTGVMD